QREADPGVEPAELLPDLRRRVQDEHVVEVGPVADHPQATERGEAQEGGEQAGDDLQGRQEELRRQLEDIQRRMRQLGLKGEKGLEDAEGAMKEAEQALGQGGEGNDRRAVDAQGRALQGLQAGAGGLAQQMAQGQGQGEGQGDGEGRDGPSIGQDTSGNGTDPLGRPRDGRGTLETRGPALDEGVAARAQRVLQELRRRLGDPGRPKAETDYLERLLGPY
ncbi:MAG: DUF4175 family protein, partial [Actinomycetospora chiangmaiensis]|nr:DUF4175 family protein [Actinomycetospora chiangmaiensis]